MIVNDEDLPQKIWSNILELIKSMKTLSDLPRESAGLIIDHFSQENSQKDLRILASSLKSFRTH